ncbi:MAG: MBL fold metallo-hydrolase [Melioribacteraceae bacterium]|nr:MBL fold metallo-hydrolase [Melioribacteraceae bacterium]
MQIQFIGAAQTVTGSMHLIRTSESNFLLDCGIFQGKRKEAFEINRTFSYFNPKEIDFVILSHAHIDHSGNLPTLVKNGFEGNIYSTFATRDLCTIMLQDSAHIQEKDVEFVNKRRKKHGKNLFEPLYVIDDALNTLKRFIAINYHFEFKITPNISVTFFDAGHILGSSIVYLRIKENGKIYHIGFSGDLGRPNLPILRDPELIPPVDYWITESTYGGKSHHNPLDSEKHLEDVIRIAKQNKSKIIVPAFSVGRTQEIVYALHRIFDRNEEERIPVIVDSPLAVNATEVFRLHPECFDKEANEFIHKNEDPFGFNKLIYIKDVEDSKKLNDIEGPCFIISSSGMAETGRILHHIANNIEDQKNIILIVGYAAENTLARKLIDGEKQVNIFGEPYNVKAKIIVLDSFSAHADKDELFNYTDRIDKKLLKKIFLVHGEIEQQNIFYKRLIESGFDNVEIPQRGHIETL